MLKKLTSGGLLVAILALLWSAAPTTLISQTRAEDRTWNALPPDTVFMVTIKNMESFRAKFNASPMKLFFEHEGVQDLMAEITSDFAKELKSFRKEFGFKLEDLFNELDGETTLAVGGLEAFQKEVIKMSKPGRGKRRKDLSVAKSGLSVTYIAHAKSENAHKYIETLIDKMSEQAKNSVTRSEYAGAEVIVIDETVHYAHKGDLLIITTQQKTLEGLLDETWKKNSLGKTANFRTALNQVGPHHDFFMYVNIPEISKFAQGIIIPTLKNEAFGQMLKEEDIQRVIAAWIDVLGLNEVDSLSFGSSLERNECTGASAIATHGQVRGLVKALMANNRAWTFPSYIPQEAVAVSLAQANLAPVWEAFETALNETMDVVRTMNPNGQIPDPFESIEQMIGINLKEDVVDVMGSDFVQFGLQDPQDKNKVKSITVLTLKDPAHAETTMDKLGQGVFLQVDKKKHAGTTVYTMNLPTGGDSPSFMVYEKNMFFADEAWLNQHIDHQGEAASRFKDNEVYKQLSARFPKEAADIGFWSPEIFGQLKSTMQEMSKNNPWGGDIDLSNFPDVEFFKKLVIGGINYTVTSPDGAVGSFYIQFSSSKPKK